MFRHAALTIAAVLAAVPAAAEPDRSTLETVDLELVIAADTSGSVPPELVRSQRLGFAEAFRDPDLRWALSSGPLGKVAVAYFEWSGSNEQRLVVPWTILSDDREIAAFADQLELAQTVRSGGGTSISGAMLYADRLIRTNEYAGLRKVVDIASNGTNSEGPPIGEGRRALLKTGATVNALILPGRSLDQKGPYATLFERDGEPLDSYFQTEIVGGPGAFVMATDPKVGFVEAIRRKLVMEVAWSTQ